MKTKDEVFEIFRGFHINVERETRRKLKCIRVNNDSECRGRFEQYYYEHGIRLERHVPKTPQHNHGVAERMNRTICEQIRCILAHSNFPKSFWGEAMRIEVDLINLSPSAPLDDDVLERVWTGKDVSYKHLRVFGCRAYVHIPKYERYKLDEKCKPCISLGYVHEEFNYRLHDLVDKNVIKTRDIVFLEDPTRSEVE